MSIAWATSIPNLEIGMSPEVVSCQSPSLHRTPFVTAPARSAGAFVEQSEIKATRILSMARHATSTWTTVPVS
jgi:hypothetical protein